MRRLALIPALSALTLVLAACGGATPDPAAEPSQPPSSSVTSTEPDSPATTSEPSVEPTTEPEPSPEPTAEPVPVPLFTTAMVRANEVNKENKGGQSNVSVVAEGVPYESLEQVGRECVEHFLGETQAAFCHVWGTQVDYDARAKIDPGLLSCWIYYVGVPLNGGEPIVTGPGDISYHVEECPGGVVPPID